MGNADSTEKLGERVIAAKAKLEQDLKTQTERLEYLKANSPSTLPTVMQSVRDSFETCSPFLESALLIAWLHDAKQCKEIVLKACKKVLKAPIDASDYDWFKHYVFTSSVWMMPSPESGTFMYEELLEIGHAVSSTIIQSMDSIYTHLEKHAQWPKVQAIANQTIVSRQDDAGVGLLHEQGLKNILEQKSSDNDGDDNGDSSESMKNFIDSNVAVNMLTSTASRLNKEFQQHVKTVMSGFGQFQEAPMKKVERSVSKLENDYKNEAFPKAAKLLDLVRCSVTFNTVEQFIAGYDGFIKHINQNQSIIALSRVKNGFINTPDNNGGGYRDIKVNVVYKSQDPDHKNLSMICEVQLLLINYLDEKKKIHKLYSILREETYFQMAVKQQEAAASSKGSNKDFKDLKITEVLNVGKQVDLKGYSKGYVYKCSVDSELGLLGIEGEKWFGYVDLKSKQVISSYGRSRGRHTHRWFTSASGKRTVCILNGWVGMTIFDVDDNANDEVLVNNREITYCEFDRQLQQVLTVSKQYGGRNNWLEIRDVADTSVVKKQLQLNDELEVTNTRMVRLSADGSYSVLAGGTWRDYFYLVDFGDMKQTKLTTKYLSDTLAPCFINGEKECVSLGDEKGRIEIWNVEKKKPFKQFQTDTKRAILSSESVNNILAIGSTDKKLRLYDVRSWECFYTKQFNTSGKSLHLTDDLRYLTFAGEGEDLCVVLAIE